MRYFILQLEPDEVDADAEEFLNELNLLSDVPVVYPGTVTIVMLITSFYSIPCTQTPFTEKNLFSYFTRDGRVLTISGFIIFIKVGQEKEKVKNQPPNVDSSSLVIVSTAR